MGKYSFISCFCFVLLSISSCSKPADPVNPTPVPATTKGWHQSGDFTSTNFVVSFGELPSGRILAALFQNGYLQFSDDEGTTWQRLTSFPMSRVSKLITTPENEVFLARKDSGMFYSPDGGLHWEARNTGLPLNTFSGDIQYTSNHLLFSLTADASIYKSADKGLSWHQVTYGLDHAGFSCVSATKEANIYAIHNNHLVQSADGGEGWREVYTLSSTTGLSWLYIDDNDDIYIAAASGIGMSYGLYVSKDQAQTWTKVFDPVVTPPASSKMITRITKRNGNYYFYSTEDNTLMKTADFATYEIVPMPVGNNNGRFSFTYFITANDHKIVSTEFYGLYYYIP